MAVAPTPATTETAEPAPSRSNDEYARCEGLEVPPPNAFVFEDHSKDPLYKLRHTVLAAREALQEGKLEVAKSGYETALDAWKSPFAVHCAHARNEPEGLKLRCAQAALFASEAYFRHAQLSRQREALAADLPEYTGFQYAGSDKPMERMSLEEFQEEMRLRGRSSKELKAHIDTSVKAWVERRRAAVEAADAAYSRVPRMGPFATPCWQLAAGREIAGLWDSFADAFETAPMPAWMARDAELSASYRSQLLDASARLREPARAGHELCSKIGRQEGRPDLASRCDAWLASHPKSEAAMGAGSP